MTRNALSLTGAATLLLLAAVSGIRLSSASLLNGSNSLCQCTPRSATTSSYLDSLNSYTADMIVLLNEISTQLTSLGLKLSDFSSAVLARLLKISASSVEATNVANALLASLNSNSSSSSGSSGSSGTLSTNCTTSSLTFFGDTIFGALGSGGSYSGGKWTLAISGGALTVDYGVKSCTSQTQYVRQICIDGYPSQVYIFTQASTSASASLLIDSLTVSSQSGAVCVTVGAEIMAFTVLPKALKSTYSLMPNYQFTLNVTGCFKALPASCTPTMAPTTVIPCTLGNALAEVGILPVDFFYNAKVSRIDGIVINATSTGAASATFLADLTADGCRATPNITQVCATGNFFRMKIGELVDYQGTIEQFPGSENVTAASSYKRFCYTVNFKLAILAIQPENLAPGEVQFKFFPEARGCFDPVSSSCVARPACVGPLEVGWHSAQLPQQSLVPTNMSYTAGQWVATGTDASLMVDLTAGGCRKSAGVTQVCITATNASGVTLSAAFLVGEGEFNSTNTLTGAAAPTSASPWCQSYSAAPTMKWLIISFSPSSAIVNLKWTITGCFSTLPAYCQTTTAAPATATTTVARAAESCTAGFPTLTNADANVPASAISGGSFVSTSSTWTVAKGSSLTIDLTVGSCRQSARPLAICVLGNAATVRVDYILEDSSRLVLGDSASKSDTATGSSLCFTFASGVYAKSLVLLPTALKTASASDATYSLMVNLSACYSSISASCYSPICGCSANYRPVFYSKKYYKIYFKIVSGFYSVYKNTFASPVTSDYLDLLNMTDTMIYQNFGAYKDKYEGIDQVTFTSGSVVFEARLIMHSGGYTASELDSALTAGMSSYTAGATFVVDGTSIVISDIDSSTASTSTAASTISVASTITAASSSTSVDLALLLGLLIPLLVVFIVLLILLILLCKYCRCCCFSKTDSVAADVKAGRAQETGTSMSTADLLAQSDNQPFSARGEHYQYTEGGEQKKQDGDQLPMPTTPPPPPPPPQRQKGHSDNDEGEDSDAQQRRKRRKKSSRIAVMPLASDAADGGYGGAAATAEPMQFDRRQWDAASRPDTPKTVSIETFTYQLRQTREAD